MKFQNPKIIKTYSNSLILQQQLIFNVLKLQLLYMIVFYTFKMI